MTKAENGIGNDTTYDVKVFDNKIYSGHFSGGLYISTDGGQNFNRYSSGLGSTGRVYKIFINDTNNIYLATLNGVGVTTNGGDSFNLYDQANNGLGNNQVNDILVDSDGNIYAATQAGLSVLPVGSTTFTNYTSSDGLVSTQIKSLFLKVNSDNTKVLYTGSTLGLGYSNSFTNVADLSFTSSNKFTISNSDLVNGDIKAIYIDNSNIYLATYNYMAISTDNGANFTLKGVGDGLGDNRTKDIYVDNTGLKAVLTDSGLSIKNQ